MFNKKNGDFENPTGIIDVFNRIFGTGSQENKETAFLNRCHQIAVNKYKNQNHGKLNESKMRWYKNTDPKLILRFLTVNLSNIFGIKNFHKDWSNFLRIMLSVLISTLNVLTLILVNQLSK